MTNPSGERRINLAVKTNSKSRKLYCNDQELNYTSFITKHQQHKAQAKTETAFSQNQKTLRWITGLCYDYAGLEILCS